MSPFPAVNVLTKSQTVSFELEEVQHDWLKRAFEQKARKKGISLNEYVKQIFLLGLEEEIQDVY
jgi:hypothetical protein